MPFCSVLFEGSGTGANEQPSEAPAFFRDLNLDQLVSTVTAGWEEYHLEPFYSTPLRDMETIAYRQQILQDLEDPALMQAIRSFSGQMQRMRARLDQAKKLYYRRATERCFLGAVEIYCAAIERLAREIEAIDLSSQGLGSFRSYLGVYAASSSFRGLKDETAQLESDLASIRYGLLIRGGSVTVRNFGGEEDTSAAVEKTFEKFRSGEASSKYWVKLRGMEGMNHIQALILDRVALLYPEVFRALETFCADHAEYLDETIARFDREIQFYVSYLTYVDKFRRAGLSFCRPGISRSSKRIQCFQAFDPVLANKLIESGSPVVTNDFFLAGAERIFVVSGPNQGGKTTFARTFGQLHFLASLGCTVPGTAARLFLFDRIFTHFEQQEEIANLRGKLENDLVRIRQILDQATPHSLLILNEIFASTTLQDAVYLSRKVLEEVSALDLLAVCVTFIDELATLNEKTVSVVSAVDPAHPAVRTYKLDRRPADGLAYAHALAEKHRVTYQWLRERIQP
ncbi:MAG: MutS-related protein [Terracidiphilus sp.]